MAGEKLLDQPISRTPRERRQPFWERRISRRAAIVGTATVVGTVASVALLDAITGRNHSEPTPAAKTGSNTASKPNGQATQAGTNLEKGKPAETTPGILGATLQDMDGKEISVKDLAAQKPTILLTWSVLEKSSIISLDDFTREVYPKFATAPVQFLAVEIWEPLQRFKADLANPPHGPLEPLPFPMVVDKGTPKNPSFYGTGKTILIDKGGANMQELSTLNFDQIASAITRLTASGN